MSKFTKADYELIDTAEAVLRRVLVRWKTGKLSKGDLDRMKLLEASVTNLEVLRLA